MNPPPRLQASWLQASPTRAVMQALESARPGGSRFVGGCVRNALLGLAVDDLDIATQLPPEQVAAIGRAAGLGVHPTGIEHGTITLVAAHQPFEVTTLRRDVSTDGRRAVVAFTEDWAQDAARRDFHLNALYADAEGQVFDPTGAGLEDLAAGRIRFVGEPQRRIREDYLRILRFFRFTAWYGREVDREGLAACAAHAEGVGRLSAERVWKEFKKLLAARDPRLALAAMQEAGVLEVCLPEGADPAFLRALLDQDLALGLPPDPLLRFAALGVAAAGRRLRISRAEADRLAAALDGAPAHEGISGQALYWLGPRTVEDRVRLAWARAGEAPADWRAQLDRVAQYQRPVFPVHGGDLQALGFAPGPALGAALRGLERWWVDHGSRADRATLLAQISAPEPPA